MEAPPIGPAAIPSNAKTNPSFPSSPRPGCRVPCLRASSTGSTLCAGYLPRPSAHDRGTTKPGRIGRCWRGRCPDRPGAQRFKPLKIGRSASIQVYRSASHAHVAPISTRMLVPAALSCTSRRQMGNAGLGCRVPVVRAAVRASGRRSPRRGPPQTPQTAPSDDAKPSHARRTVPPHGSPQVRTRSTAWRLKDSEKYRRSLTFSPISGRLRTGVLYL